MSKGETVKGLDVIGDVHGHADALRSLLLKLGYAEDKTGTYLHPANRQSIFVGDLLNRGPKVRETLQIVRAMAEAKSARVILGNHEFNVLGMATKGKDGAPLRPHSKERLVETSRTEAAYRDAPEEWKDCLRWIRTLPLSLELQGMRVVHAAWHRKSLEIIAGRTFENDAFLQAAFNKKSAVSEAVKITLKGIKVPLPKNKTYRDRFGIPRKKARIRWWMNPLKKSYAELLFPPYADAPRQAGPPDDSLKSVQPYPENAWPVFIGHYCLSPNEPKIHGNVVCVDGCVTCNGTLWAYQFDGEDIPIPGKLVSASGSTSDGSVLS